MIDTSNKTNETKKLLIVDDDAAVGGTVGSLLEALGHEIMFADDGFDALLKMRTSIPDLIISDLNMPVMSGFEFLSVVRRRFPEIAVIAMSGAYESGEAIPGGVIADAFYPKGGSMPPDKLRALVTNLLRGTAKGTHTEHTRLSAPVWVPRNGNDSRGIPYIVLTCTDCLRSFPLNVTTESTAEVMKTPCIFCLQEVRYIIDFTLSVASPRNPLRMAKIAGKEPTVNRLLATDGK